MIDVNGPFFIDKETNRTILFHGINVGGGAKLPVGIPSHSRQGFWVDYDRKITFVGRPFPLEEADLHFQRLVSLGFNLLRFVITWEAIEHEGPGIYDTDYLDYVIALLKKCQYYGLRVFIDPHQDTWSRQCGGSGHPGWTLTLAGLNPLHFNTTIAALVQNTYDKPETFPRMIWNTNYQRLAAATLFTLFFAGKTFAPKCIVDQVNIQDYLQSHFFNAIAQLSLRIRQDGLEDEVVLGYDSMNEPGHGYLGFPDLDKLDDSDTSFKMGLMPTPFQGMLLASGIPCNVAHYDFIWSGPKKTGDVRVDPGDDTSAWLSQEQVDESCMTFGWKRGASWKKAGCIWELHGVWDRTTGTLLSPHYFATDPTSEKPTRFADDYWLAFLASYIRKIRSVHKNAIIFVQPPILDKPPKLPREDPLYQRLVYTPHWYDGLTLVKKKWCNYNIDFINLNRGKYGTGPLRFLRALCLGENAIRKCFIKQMETIRAEGLEQIGNYPCLLGEIGIPYDMKDDSLANTSSSIWRRLWLWFISLFFADSTMSTLVNEINKPGSSQNKAMDASLNAVESSLLNYTLWQYVPDNDPFWGDLWNGEDLSIWQQQQQTDKYAIRTTQWATTLEPIINEIESPVASTIKSLSPTIIGSEQEASIPFGINHRQLVCLYRPRPQMTAGTPIAVRFTSPTETSPAYYRYEFHPGNHVTTKITELYVPNHGFPPPQSEEATQVMASRGKWKLHKTHQDYWLLHWWWSEEDQLDGNTTMVLELKGVKWIV
ncbi:glycoside hydrolase superfamily [Chlamydoabsidia padenii]|nr:glycoside hydrolase superfamily [Chlamydoabsidia padenii]